MIRIGAAQSMSSFSADSRPATSRPAPPAAERPGFAGFGAVVPPAQAIAISGLRKVYRGGAAAKPALDAVDLVIPRGSLYGLLGPNGAGKSTLINILAGLVLKTVGRVSIWGIDIDAAPRQARAAIGVVPQELNIDPFFTPREMLDMHAGFYGVPRGERKTDEILPAGCPGGKAHLHVPHPSGRLQRRRPGSNRHGPL